MEQTKLEKKRDEIKLQREENEKNHNSQPNPIGGDGSSANSNLE